MFIRKKRAFARLSPVLAAVALAAFPVAAEASFGDRALRTGSTGHDVRVLQSWLDKMGFNTSIDGHFGRNTRWNLRRFEQARGLRINGVLARSDAAAMRQAMASRFKFRGGGDEADDISTDITPGSKARMASDGLRAVAPADAPQRVKDAIAAANKIVGKPYKYGGGHARVEDSGYDCSGTVSYALRGAGLLDTPMSSGEFRRWGTSGRGKWISVYYHGGHMYAVIAGLRLDTSGSGGKGPRWHTSMRSPSGYGVRHWRGL